jgi:hypothetical protein
MCEEEIVAVALLFEFTRVNWTKRFEIEALINYLGSRKCAKQSRSFLAQLVSWYTRCASSSYKEARVK